jgi:hypothetical protein
LPIFKTVGLNLNNKKLDYSQNQKKIENINILTNANIKNLKASFNANNFTKMSVNPENRKAVSLQNI